MESVMKPIRIMKNGREEEDGGEPLSPMSRLFHKPDSNFYIIAMLGFAAPISPDVVKLHIARTFPKHPRFSSLQVVDEKNGGELRWVKTEVNIDNHVIIPKLDPNMDSPDKFVEDYVSNLSKTTISMSIPLWDFHVLEVKTSEAEATAVLRVHHSIGDGISLMSLLLSCSRQVSDPESLPTIPTARKSNGSKKNNESLLGFLRFLLIKLGLLVLLCWNTAVDVVMFVLTYLFLNDTANPLKAQRLGPSARRFVHTTLSFDDVKLVKNAMAATVNDVLVGVTQAALSRYLNRKYGIEDGDTGRGKGRGKNNLPKNIRFRATCFVNMRPFSGIQTFEEMIKKGSKAKWGNYIAYLLFPFTIALRDNPLDYVRDAKLNSDRKKASLEAKCIYFMARLLLKFYPTMTCGFPTQTSICYSNVPGPQEQISFCGYPLAFIAPSCCGQPNALFVHIVSYVNKIKIILAVDETIIPDPYQLCDDFQISLKLIKDATL
ncbi:wax ester synthase/diacylglycerol acyltransferase 11-like isoform X2 [Mercurialis annua]|uniref:wax ester synthase/diacylglycerol acyltransferase 11-like isoform X2 n=1 Tax=Mercurialis annua TaxID=3986 RepID=UPI00215F3D67|nr:wax ester synthase/diacylglycerol acyltransferase 11-like isoform X2 [Mercurialis annua]